MAETKIQTVGKRKTAVARVWLKPGTGQIVINHKPMDEYIVRATDKLVIRQPLVLTETLEKYDVYITVKGGGISGQAGAIRHGISRALIGISPELRPTLKKVSFLTRDSRAKERKKYGLKSARARFQYSKR
jgi:small subunit ribosomal protein S9